MATATRARAKTNGSVPARGAGSDEPFHWVSPDGVEIEVRSMSKAFETAGELRAHRNDSPLDIAYWIIEKDCNKEQLAALDKLTMDEFNEFSRLWAEHSGISTGD